MIVEDKQQVDKNMHNFFWIRVSKVNHEALLISVGGGIYEGLLEPYSGLTSEHLLLIRIPIVPQTLS